MDEHIRADATQNDLDDCQQDKEALEKIVYQKDAIVNIKVGELGQKEAEILQWQQALTKEQIAHAKDNKRLKRTTVAAEILGGTIVLLGLFVAATSLIH